MKSRTQVRACLVLVTALALWLPAHAAQATPPSAATQMAPAQFEKLPPGVKHKVEGVIMEAQADSFTMRGDTGATYRIQFDGNTKIQERKSGWFGGSRKYAPSQLIQGLRVQAEGKASDTGALMATKVQFREQDLVVARVVDYRVKPVETDVSATQTRVGETETRIGASEENARHLSTQIDELNAVSNAAQGGARAAQESADAAQQSADTAMTEIRTANQKFATFVTDLDQFEVKKTVSVLFKVGSATLSDDAKKSLDQVTQESQSEHGFAIEVTGYASADGSNDANKRLSRRRADTVVEYLVDHGVPLRRIVMPYGHGEGMPVADNKTRDGRAQNRRVDVKMLVNRGLAPGETDSASSGSNAGLESASSMDPR